MNGLFKLSDKTYTLGSCRGSGVGIFPSCGSGGGGGDGGGGSGGEIVSLCYAQSYFPLNTFNHTENV
jgi:hypothetical protein